MPSIRFVLLLLLLAGTMFHPFQAQDKRVISGGVTDASSGAPLPFATIALKKQLIGTVTNEYGKFDLTCPIHRGLIPCSSATSATGPSSFPWSASAAGKTSTL